jgi:hypothetical protein
VDVPEEPEISFNRVEGGMACSHTSNVDPMLLHTPDLPHSGWPFRKFAIETQDCVDWLAKIVAILEP